MSLITDTTQPDSSTANSQGGLDIQGAAGNDRLNGGTGNDNITLGGGDDLLDAAGGNDFVDAGEGSDSVLGFDGDDTIDGGNGNDSLQGNVGNDSISGGDGNDILYGGRDNDILDGGSGDDFVSGDRGSDVLTGGAGADIFNFGGFGGDVPQLGLDTLVDFNLAEGDKIRLDKQVFFGTDTARQIDAAEFQAGTPDSAGTSAAKIIYDAATGLLYFNVDSLPGNETAFAQLPTGLDPNTLFNSLEMF
jgi:Ca2+-binding RTX toxin-like protein